MASESSQDTNRRNLGFLSQTFRQRPKPGRVASATAQSSAAADASAESLGGCRIPSFVLSSVRVDMPSRKGSRKLESSRHKQEIWRMPRQPPKLRRMPRQPPKFRRLPTVILSTEIPFVSFREQSLANIYWTSNPVVREEYQLVKPPNK